LDYFCNGVGYDLQEDLNFNHFVSPPPRILCFAQVHINPVLCTTISSKEITEKVGDKILHPDYTAWNTIFDYRLGLEIRDKYDATKCCTFYIHVEIHKPDWVYHLRNHRKDTFHYAEGLQELYGNSDLYFSNPFKLSYWMEYSEKLQSFKVIQKAIIGCHDHPGYFNHKKHNCEMHLKSPPEFYKCVSIADNEYIKLRDVVILNKNSNYQTIKSIVQVSCSKPVISYPSEDTVGSFPSNYFLRQYKPSEVDLEPMFIKIMFSNSTVVSKIWTYALGTIPNSLALKTIILKSIFVVSTPFDDVHFVTCAPLQQRKFLSLLGYISAFDLATWMVILLSVILSVLAWNYILKKTKKSSFSAVFILKILLGQGTNEIQNVRLITGAWVLTGLFLSYNYQGNNIDQLTSPFAPKKFETFSEILANNFKVYSLPKRYKLLRSEMPLSQFRPEEDYGYFNQFYWNPIEVTFGKIYLHQKSRNTTRSIKAFLKKIVKIPANHSEMINMLPLKYYIDTISKCNQDVFAETMSYILKLRTSLLQGNIEDSDISKSKVAFGQMYHFWKISNMQMIAEDYARRRFGLIESGIVRLWNVWKSPWSRGMILWKQRNKFPRHSSQSRLTAMLLWFSTLTLPSKWCACASFFVSVSRLSLCPFVALQELCSRN